MDIADIPISDGRNCLTGRLCQLAIKIHRVVELIASPDAKRFIQHGVMRRLFIIRHNAAFILDFAPTSEHGIGSEAATELTMHANSLYLHLRGLFDNLAWAIAFEFPEYGEVSEENHKDRRKVNLFRDDFIKHVPCWILANKLLEHKQWHHMLKEFRDPIAHRLPMYAVPSIISEEDADRYAEIESESVRALFAMDLDEHERLKKEQASLTKYIPILCHSLKSDPFILPMKDQVAQDIGIAMEIVDATWILWARDSVSTNKP